MARRRTMGELALGRNVLVAFMPWGGYNFEDSILISERLSSGRRTSRRCTSKSSSAGRAIHEARVPKEITRDIPNVGEEALKDLDERGIIRIGAEVKGPGDILVGKITPKGDAALAGREAVARHLRGQGRRCP